MFRKVRDAVLQSTGGRQEPFVYGSLSSKGFYLGGRPVKLKGDGGESGRLSAEMLAAERLFWNSVRDRDRAADFRAYLARYPNGTFAALARIRLDALIDAQKKVVPETTEAALALKPSARKRIQIALRASGFNTGSPDGEFGKRTRNAIRRWQAARGKPSTGFLNSEAAKALLEIAPDLSGGVWTVVANSPCKIWNGNPVPGESVTWSGTCVDGKASGKGRVVWTSGEGEGTYQGQYLAGRQHGRGTETWPNGDRYEGEYKNNKRHGRGTYIWNDGSRYEGQFRNGKRHGRGTETSPNGDRYEGQFQNGKEHGQGIFTGYTGNRYEGQFRNGKAHGQGILTQADGVRWEGIFRDNQIHGWGILYDKSGERIDAGRAVNGCFYGGGGWFVFGSTKRACGFK